MYCPLYWRSFRYKYSSNTASSLNVHYSIKPNLVQGAIWRATVNEEKARKQRIHFLRSQLCFCLTSVSCSCTSGMLLIFHFMALLIWVWLSISLCISCSFLNLFTSPCHSLWYTCYNMLYTNSGPSFQWSHHCRFCSNFLDDSRMASYITLQCTLGQPCSFCIFLQSLTWHILVFPSLFMMSPRSVIFADFIAHLLRPVWKNKPFFLECVS